MGVSVVGPLLLLASNVVGRISLVNKTCVLGAAGPRTQPRQKYRVRPRRTIALSVTRYQRNGVNVQQYECRRDFSRCAMDYLVRMPVEHGVGLLSNQTEKPHHYT